jgi:hypothetical protein
MPINPDLVIFAVAKLKEAGVPEEQIQAFVADKGYRDPGTIENLRKRAVENREDNQYLEVINSYDQRLAEYMGEQGLSTETVETLKGVL